ncbi:MAG TPA: DUF4331 family protein [Kofleriaceae bacterium]|jgi:hypothetical protein
MKTNATFTALCLVLSLGVAACGDDSGGNCATPDAHNGSDAGSGSGSDGGPQPATYKQIEHLGRPGIAEALLLTNGFLDGYNSTAPSFTGVPTATLNMVVGEAKTVLHAAFYGVCLLNGVAGFTTTTGFHPGGVACAAVGTAIFTENTVVGTHITADMKTAADTYADAVFGLFEPDVMRIDTAVASEYFTLCGATAKQGLCGGRLLNDDVIDMTYNFLFTGGAVTGSAKDQVHALVSDGVTYTQEPTKLALNVGSTVPPPTSGVGMDNNSQQGRTLPHIITDSFPYSGAPY